MPAPLDGRLNEWFREHGAMVRGVVRAYIRDPDEMEDLFQDVWVTVVKRMDHVPADGLIKKWLFLLTRTACKDHLRKKGRRQRLLDGWIGGEGAQQPGAASPSIESHFQLQELWAEVDRLPQLQKDVLLLRVFQDLSVRETAERLGRPEGSVRGYLSLARKTLREKVTSNGR